MEIQQNETAQDNVTMKESVLEKRVKKSELKAKDIFAYEYLMKKAQGLLPLQIEEEEEDIIMHFSLEGMHPLAELKSEEAEYRWRFVCNWYILYQTWLNYELSFDEENIYYDNNFMPYIAFRDIRMPEENTDEEIFLEEYRCLAASVLSNKYSYSQVKESGIEILKKDKKAAFVLEERNLADFYLYAKQKADEIYEDNRQNKIRLDKKKYRTRNRIAIGVLAALLAVIVYTGYQSFVILPRDKAVIKASRAYTIQNYVDCIDCLRRIKPEQMDTYTKYILAVSYAKSEALEKAELDNILDKLSIYSNEIELEYWIAIGRSVYDRAENIAQALSDDKLLIYAYMKELNYLEGNVTMDGEEKQNRMTQLSNAIIEIGKKYTTDEDK